MKLALDTASKRHKDENGFLHVSISNISKECVSGYYGYEIPNYLDIGLDPDKIYYAYRKGEELAKGAHTFNGLPLLSDHYIEHAKAPQKEYRIGSLGTNARFESPYLQNSLIVTDDIAIKKIENNECVELSAAYMYTPIFEKGIFEGQEYDFIMTNIRGNHVALVVNGRAGSDVFVADSMPSTKNKGIENMKEDINEDNENIEIQNTQMQEINEESIENTDLQEQDSALSSENQSPLTRLAMNQELIENLPKYMHSIKMISQLLHSLTCLDSLENKDKEDKEDEKKFSKTAMDSQIKEDIKKEALEELRAVDLAISHCQPLVGDLDPLAFDSADLVYLKACNLLNFTARKESAKDVVLALKKSSNLAENIYSNNESDVFMSRFQ